MIPYRIKINGQIYENPIRDQLLSLGLSDTESDRVAAKMDRYREQSLYYERKWRNAELLLTDKLLPEDATYHGKNVRGSTMLDEITAYRQTLREYDLKCHPRPERPEWFDG